MANDKNKKQSTERVTQRSSSRIGTQQRNSNQGEKRTVRASKGKAQERKTKQREGNPDSTAHQLLPYVLVCLAPFVALSFIVRDFLDLGSAMGAFGSFLANFLSGLLGVAAYLLPVFMVWLGIRWRRLVKKGKLQKKLILSAVLLVLLSAIIHTFQDGGARGVIDLSIVTLYEDGSLMVGGGLIGGLFGELFGYVFRLLGTCLICLPALAIVAIYLADMTPLSFWEFASGKFYQLKEKIEEKRNQRNAQKMDKKERAAAMADANETEQEYPTWRKNRRARRAERAEKSQYFSFDDAEDEVLQQKGDADKADVVASGAEAEVATANEQEEVAPTQEVQRETLDGHVVDAPFSLQYYQRAYEQSGAEPITHGESRVTDSGFGIDLVDENGALSHGESRVTDRGFGVGLASDAPASQGESRVTDRGFGVGLANDAPVAHGESRVTDRGVGLGVASDAPSAHGESRLTDAGLGIGRATEGGVSHGESRVTDAGFGVGMAGESAPLNYGASRVTDPGFGAGMASDCALAASGESRVTDAGFGAGMVGEGAPVRYGESRLTDAGLGMGYGDMAGDDEPVVHGESRMTEAGLGLGYSAYGDKNAPVSHGESRVTDPGFSPERLINMATGTGEHGESRLTQAGFDGTLQGEYELANPGESRLTYAGFDGSLGHDVELANPGESRLTEAGFDGTLHGDTTQVIMHEQGESQLTEPPLGTAFGDQYAQMTPHHVAPVKQPEPEPEPEPEPRPYEYPTTDLLNEDSNKKNEDHTKEISEKITILRKTLADFRINIKDQVDCFRGPTVTRYEVRLEGGVSMRQIQNRIDDISLYMAAPVRIAAVQGKPAVGIEVPNTVRDTVFMRTMLESPEFQNSKKQMEVPLGLDIGGSVQMCDLAAMPHLLIAGTTGSGKSVCINSILLSLIYKTSPDDLRMILIDPKQIEFAPYEHIPHLYMPIVTDMQRAAGALACAVQEMERRFSLLKDVGVRDIASYNEAVKNDPDREHLPRILIVIDEFADLKMSCANNDPENFTCRLAQKARAAGIHLIIGTQRPSVDVITGKLKTNIASRIAFMVKQQVDSRTILDMNGAEMLAGRGDMLFAPANSQDKQPRRIQGAYVSDSELERVIAHVRRHNDPVRYNKAFMEQIEVEMARAASAGKKDDFDDIDAEEGGEDPKFVEAVELAVQTQKVATSLLQRRLGVGYGRAAKIIDRMEELGLVSPAEGNKPRKLLPAAQGYLDHIQHTSQSDFYED